MMMRGIFIFLFLIFLGVGGYYGYTNIFRKFYAPNVLLDSSKDEEFMFIPTGAVFTDVLMIAKTEKLVRDASSFEWTANLMKYPNSVKAGRYKLEKGMNNRELVKLLRSGQQTPLNLRINMIHYSEELAGLVGNHLEADSAEVHKLLTDHEFLSKYNVNPQEAFSLIIGNTYQFFWNTNATAFFDRMYNEYNKFWTEERLAKARTLNMTPAQISTMASIIQEEARQREELSKIAGVYYNRLRINMPLQADPTVRYLLKNKSTRRIYTKNTEIESPYNTYKYRGLPPGPIAIPQTDALDAALNPEKHDFLYFVAREDFSGYHNFSKTYEEHLINRRKYINALNRRGVR
jgi:UPF0755 protein